MKGKIIVSAFWTALFSAGRACGITVFPFIFLRHEALRLDQRLLNHERIHLQQALELFVLPFYIWYFVEFLFRYARCKDFDRAYRHICFEHEAYANEADLKYLRQRKRWAFFKYLNRRN